MSAKFPRGGGAGPFLARSLFREHLNIHFYAKLTIKHQPSDGNLGFIHWVCGNHDIIFLTKLFFFSFTKINVSVALEIHDCKFIHLFGRITIDDRFLGTLKRSFNIQQFISDCYLHGAIYYSTYCSPVQIVGLIVGIF